MKTARLSLRVPEVREPVVLELAQGSAVLVGREPDLTKLVLSLYGLDRSRIEQVVVDSPLVSANHLLVHYRVEGLYLSDLNSRNGSWLRLVPGREVKFPVVELTIDLARPTIVTTEGGPADAVWDEPESYPSAMLLALKRWLEQNAIDARISLRPEGISGEGATFGLASGGMLAVETGTGGTLTGGWMDRAAAWVHSQNVVYEQEQGHEDGFVMASRSIRRAHRQVAEAALREQRLVLLGETGSGKEQFARCYHRHSRRAEGPFLVLNCGGLLNNELIHSELFGAQRGAFTGCVRDIVGAVEAAHGGTLVLDEIGDLPAPVQVALLRFLDRKGEYRRLGDVRTRTADVRIVSSTNRDLEALVEKGGFRADLWYRLNGEVVRIPPLRERPEDVRTFLARQELLPGLRVTEVLSSEALQFLMAQPWPGNFRELENFVGRLPSELSDGRVEIDGCRRALRRSEAAELRDKSEVAVGGPLSRELWAEVQQRATAAWIEDHAEVPRAWAELERYQEEYLKPVFVAYATGRRDVRELSRALNFAEMARSLHLSDGARAKAYLARYIERFRRSAAGKS